MSRKRRAAGPPEISEAELAARLERAKAQSVPQLLFKTARLLNERALARLEPPPGATRLRAAHTSLFPHLDREGKRLTELAGRLGISKQAVGQLVDELEQLGMVERIPDPLDGRAKLIRFSKRGAAALLDGLAHLDRLERELVEQLGSERMQALHETLTLLLELLEQPSEAE